jgi:hypothetical protein
VDPSPDVPGPAANPDHFPVGTELSNPHVNLEHPGGPVRRCLGLVAVLVGAPFHNWVFELGGEVRLARCRETTGSTIESTTN